MRSRCEHGRDGHGGEAEYGDQCCCLDASKTDVYALAVSQGRIILTINVKDFHPLLRNEAPGIIGIPEAWSAERIDTKLTALRIKHGANYFQGRYHLLGVGVSN
jgi:hypothetical protein